MTRSLLVSLCLLVAVGLRAQAPTTGAPPRPPIEPPSSISWDSRDAGFAAYRAAGAGGVVAAPFLHEGKQYLALVQSAVSRGRPGFADSLLKALERCSERLRLDAPYLARAVEGRAFQSFEQATAGQPLVSITIVPVPTRRSGCIEKKSERLVVEAGLITSMDTLGLASQDAKSVEVFVGSTRVEPALVGSAAITRLAPAYVDQDGLFALRVYLSAENLAPRDSTPPVLSLKVYNAEHDVPEVIAFKEELTDLLRRELLAWRAQRLATATGRTGFAVALPPPENVALRESRSSFEAGAYSDATAQAVARLAGRRLSSADRVTSGLQVGLTFAELGDEAAASMALRKVMEEEPCLALPAGAPSTTKRLMEEVRPPARCEPWPLGEVAVLGLVPGRAHRRLRADYSGSGVMPAALVLGTAIGSVALHLNADRLRKEYEAVVGDPSAEFETARSAHELANVVGVATYVVWGATIAHALWQESRYAKRIASMQVYASDAQRRVSVGVAPRGLGFSISFF
ncbi:MAG: hypothetical protein KF709_09970 [Gemmatimonadaceae bacterium]|nr:hypothetical protein [Gemmatimonadaceae bacterium]